MTGRRALVWVVLVLAASAGSAASSAGSSASAACPARCSCWGAHAACPAAGLRAPPTLPKHVTALDVSSNNISWSAVSHSLAALLALRDLNLSRNPLWPLDPPSVSPARPPAALRRLWLDACGLHVPPLRAEYSLQQLHLLSLSENVISAVGPDSFPPLPALHTLIVRRNRISSLHHDAFINTPNIRVLRLDENRLTSLPPALALLTALEDLSVAHNLVWSAGPLALHPLSALARLDLRGNPLGALHERALDQLGGLQMMLLSEARSLHALPLLNGSVSLHVLRADRCRLHSLPAGICKRAPNLRVLDLKLNQLTRLPDLHECDQLRVLDLSSNAITSLVPDEEAIDEDEEFEQPAASGGASEPADGSASEPADGSASEPAGGSLSGLRRLTDLLLARNLIRHVSRTAFRHTPMLQLLNLEGNQIEHIDTEAFVPINKLEDLNVGENQLSSLPDSGLWSLRHLKAHNNPLLRRAPPPLALPNIHTLLLSYAYHCCEWLPMGTQMDHDDDTEEGGLSDLVVIAGGRVDAAAWANASALVWPAFLNASRVLGPSAIGGRRRVQCAPSPGPFLPCEDLFDWWTLRCGVWAVFLLALLGNGTVVFVLLWSRARLDVPRFLVTNLAGADLCMGCYLGLLAVLDAGTLGEFRQHAVAWQLSAGCRLAGFLAVLSTELSVYTLAVITLERNYAITHAMHLNKRLSLRHAMVVMAAGWALALLAATLPLFGISDYRTFAVCLPFETRTPSSLGYVLGLLAANGAAFLVLLGCYLKMYCAIRGSQAWNSNDSRIAKRMALLVFTDFLCWAPVALCALAAALGSPLVSLEQAKVLTVFVLPLNSCCNPFLYAILTKQFKKDCALVCKAIEESRVTRGIGRCRHSSNFSNRQTPANTNSLAERSSRGGGPNVSCACRALLSPQAITTAPPLPRHTRLLRWLRRPPPPPLPALPPSRPPARTGSVSSSVEFSSSRSDSWRTYGRPPPPRRAASWLVARKTSQDSNLSSSRNDSSGSNATASTGTWRTSRSACSAPPTSTNPARPRLTRQPAIIGDDPPPPPSPTPRLRTIPSAAETDAPLDVGDELR